MMDADTTTVSVLARAAMSLPPKTLIRLLKDFCTFDIPEGQALIDRAIPPPRPGQEMVYRDRVADLRAAPLVAKAFVDPDKAIDLSPTALGLPTGSDIDSAEAAVILLAVLRQMYCLTSDGIPEDAIDVSPAKYQANRLLNYFGPRPANATRSAIVALLFRRLEKIRLTGRGDADTSAIAMIAAKLGEVLLTKTSLDVERVSQGSKNYDVDGTDQFLLTGDIDELRRLLPATPNIQGHLGTRLATATLQLQQGKTEAAFAAADAIAEEMLAKDNLNNIINGMESPIGLHLFGGDKSGALALARRAAEALMALPNPRVYSLAVTAAHLAHLDDRQTAVELCRRGYDIYKTTLPGPYPDHYYLAYAAYWAGLDKMFFEIKSTLAPKDCEIFWIWFIMLATDHRDATPNDTEALAHGGKGLWSFLIQRAIVLGDREKARTLLPTAIQATVDGSSSRRPYDLRTLASYAVCLGLPGIATSALEHAAQIANAMGKSPDGIQAQLNVLTWKRAFACKELAPTMRLP